MENCPANKVKWIQDLRSEVDPPLETEKADKRTINKYRIIFDNDEIIDEEVGIDTGSPVNFIILSFVRSCMSPIFENLLQCNSKVTFNNFVLDKTMEPACIL